MRTKYHMNYYWAVCPSNCLLFVSYQHFVRADSLLEHLRFLVLVSLNLGFDGLPLHFDIASVVLHRLIRLFSVVLLQEALSVSNDSIDVGLVFNCNLQSAIPSVQLNVKFDCSVE